MPEPVLVVEVFPASDAERSAWAAVGKSFGAVQAAGLPMDKIRLIGGAMVTLHVRRLGLENIEVRATADADIGLPIGLVVEHHLIDHLDNVFDERQGGNRWVSAPGAADEQVVDVLVSDPNFRTVSKVDGRQFDRAKNLHIALKRPYLTVAVLVEGTETRVSLPDTIGALALKLGARRSRDEDKDLSDIWRLLEVADAEGLTPGELREAMTIDDTSGTTMGDLGNIARDANITEGLPDNQAERLRQLALWFTSQQI